MNIHQMQLQYDPAADRLLWRVRTFGGEMFTVWLTRRMLRALWRPLQEQVTRSGIAHLMPHSNVMPEAREMLSQAARERPLPGTQFDQPFDPKPVAEPLGSEPLLPAGFKLGPGQQLGGLLLELHDSAGRNMAVQLSDELSNAFLRLLEQALNDADWGLGTVVAPAEAAATRPVTLN